MTNNNARLGELNFDEETDSGSIDDEEESVRRRTPPRLSLRNIDDELKRITEVFPDIDPEWAIARLVDMSIELLSEYLCRGGAHPKKPKTIPTSAAKSRTEMETTQSRVTVQRIVNEPEAHIYFDLQQKTSHAYRKAAVKVLASDFRQVSLNSINHLFEHFNFRYAPTVTCFGKALNGVDLKQRKGQEISIQTQGQMLYIKILNQKRITAQPIEHPPSDLVAEIDWVRQNIASFLQNSDSGTLGGEQSTENNSLIVCDICYDEYLLTEMVSCRNGHLFCIECVRNHAKESIYGQSAAILTCMEISCKSEFSRAALEKALDDKYITKLDERTMEESINLANIDNLVRCKHCNYAVIMDIPTEINKVFKCGNTECEMEVCRVCGVDWNEHFGIPCKELETDDELRLRKQMEEKMAEAIIRRCHRCKADLVKETGCNKITCRCGAKMCYVCRRPDIEYDHFCNHVRNPGKACDKCQLCSMWEDTFKLDKQILKQVQNDANDAQEALGRRRQIGVDEKIV